MNSIPKETFSIYRSSAGSGKTYRLATEFVALAIKDPNLFNKILAVTFTNKATKEMKERILSFLLKLANGEDDDLLLQVSEKTKLPNEAIALNAQLVVGKILHQYSQFSISTIDAFFQKIVKSFAKELGLLGNYKVELDQDKVKQEVIDQIIDELGNDKELTNWLVDFALAKVDENKSWNIRPQIEMLANEVFKESFRQIEKSTQHIKGDGFKSHREKIEKIKNRFEQDMKARAKKANDLIEDHGLSVDDFSGKSGGPAGYFNRIINKKEFDPKRLVPAVCENSEKWSTKTSPKKSEIQQVVEAGLQEITISIVEYFHNHIQEYTTATEVLRNFYVFGILSHIIVKLKQYRQDNDIMLISDVAIFLKEIISENETPFIYEKTGTWYQHYLIDEFQDTSGYQWLNFKPLVENGLSQDEKSMLVGDGKQSIYRWRGGDWNLILNQVKEDLSRYQPSVEELDTNWRSARKIIEFNNELFGFLPSLIHGEFESKIDGLSLPENEKTVLSEMSEDVEKLYEDVVQKVATKNQEPAKGRIEIVSHQKDANISWKERVLDELPNVIERLQDAGFEARDIAVLVRKSDEGKQVIERMIKHKKSAEAKEGYCYDAISSESLFLGNASVIRLLINTIKYCLNPEDKISFAEICYNHQHIEDDENDKSTHEDLRFILDGEVLPSAFFIEMDSLIRLPVYEMIERIIQLFNLGQEQNKGYLQAFQDLVLEYFSNESKDINDFLVWWEDKGKRKSIQMPDAINAIRVLTIHKSKGLEFKAVLVPFCDWKLDHDSTKDNFLWCKSDQKPFADIGYMPIKYSSRLEQSYFARDYFEEMFKAHIDNLNLLYVALTRAEEFLMINCPPQSNGLKNAGDLVLAGIERLCQTQENYVALQEDDSIKLYTIGLLDNEKKELKSNYKDRIVSTYKSSDWRNKIAIRKKGTLFFDPDTSEQKAKINYGLLVHEILSKIKNEKEAELIVEGYQTEGLISKVEGQTLIDQLNILFSNPQVQNWFNSDWEVKAEVPIIVKNNYPKRPDRVLLQGKKAIIIDFKTGKEKSNDKKQVMEYRSLLTEMGYLNVDVHLLYIALNKVIKVA